MVQTRSKRGANAVTKPKLLFGMEKIPEASRFVIIGQFTNALTLFVQVVLSSNVKDEFWTKQNVFAAAIFSTMLPVHWINVNFIYGVSQPFFVGFKKVAPLMVFMAFAGTAITGVLERNTNLDSYFKPLDFIGVGNVECMTMFLVGCTNFFVTKLLLSLGVGKKKD